MKQRLAVVALTGAGAGLARELAGQLAADYQVDVYIKNADPVTGEWAGEQQVNYFALPLSKLMEQIFHDYRGLIMVMALGITVRVIGSLLQDKYRDPAVVALDDRGHYAISVAAGHLGGANQLTRLVAARTGALPVITTASDQQGLLGLDLWADELGLQPEPLKALAAVAGALVNGRPVRICTDVLLPPDRVAGLGRPGQIRLSRVQPADWPKIWLDLDLVSGDTVILVTPRTLTLPPAGIKYIFMRPPVLVAGVGCRRGVAARVIQEALQSALARAGYAPGSLRGVASVDRKADEPGLLTAARQLNLEQHFFSPGELARVMREQALTGSKFVAKTIGVEGVCEPAAILGARQGKLILPKTVYGPVTVALAELRWSVPAREIPTS